MQTEQGCFGIPKRQNPPRSEVWVYTAAGTGSANGAIARYTTVGTNIGSAITYTSSATLGDSFTINTTGVYSVYASWDPSGGGAPTIGLSKNSTQLGNSIYNVSAANFITAAQAQTATSGKILFATGITNLNAGDVVRVHVDAGSNGAGGTADMVRITQIA